MRTIIHYDERDLNSLLDNLPEVDSFLADLTDIDD